MEKTRKEETVVLFPFMAQGHIRPFLTLALQIEQRFGYKIIIVNTPLNIKKLHSSIPPNSSISLMELPFCAADYGLPPDSENTDALPYTLIHNLFEASQSLKPNFNQLILDLTNQQGRPPLCIIADIFLGWSLDIVRKLGIFHLIFLTCSAYGAGVYYSTWMNLPHRETDADEFRLPDFPEVSSIQRTQLPANLRDANSKSPWTVLLRKLLPLWFETDGILVNTIEDIDQIGLQYLRRKMEGRPVLPILTSVEYQKKGASDDGMVCPLRPQKKSGVDPKKCIEWLNTHTGVVFVCFGSQNSILSSQMMELAIGLEGSRRNFIWVVRPPLEFDIASEFRSEWLPDGYEERITEQNRGLIVHKWAPQVEILSHKSTCAFLSHCGWNSVLESLSHGVPMLSWPLDAEQSFNSKFLEEDVGVNIEVGRGTRESKHENIQRAIELVTGESQKGMEMRKKACEIKEMIKNANREDNGLKGFSINTIDKFINTALSARNQ